MCLLREVDNWVSGEARRARRLRAGCLKTRFVLGLYLAPSRFSNCGFMCYFWSFLQSRACVRRSRHLLGFLTLRLRRRFRSGCIYFFREGVSPRRRGISPVRNFSGEKKRKIIFKKPTEQNNRPKQTKREQLNLRKKGAYGRSQPRWRGEAEPSRPCLDGRGGLGARCRRPPRGSSGAGLRGRPPVVGF